MSIETSFNKLESYIIKGNFRGYDPYDTLNSCFPFKFLGKWPGAIAIQIQKRNPVNIRPLLGIKKEINPKAFGLFLQAYSILYQKTNKKEYLEKADFFFNWLSENYSKDYSGKCWGYNFPWASPVKLLKAFIPSVVVTGFVIRGIYEYYRVTKRREAANIIEGASRFVLNDLPLSIFKNGICISYTPSMKDLCYNASLLGAEVLAKAYLINRNSDLKEKAILAVNWVIDQQKEDGKWNYSLDPETEKEREQVDFHQGYILESIFEIKNLLNIKYSKWDGSIQKGAEFYFNKQFFPDGRSLWRLPKEYPVEIHNQSQGIITFLKLKESNKNYFPFSETIAKWTIEYMQAPDGHFYYRNFKYYKNKISYMRWSQAWMFLAFVLLKSALSEK